MDALSNNPPVSDYLAINHEDLKTEITVALANVGTIAIASDDDIVAARETIKPLKALQAKVERIRKEEKQPFLDGCEDVDDFFKALRVELDKIVEAITTQANAFQVDKREEACKLEAAKARIAAAMDEKAPAAVAPKETVRVTAASGAVAASGTVKWDYEIVDESLLPRELLRAFEPAIKAKVAGLKAMGGKIEEAKIAGLRIFERISTAWR